MFARSAIRSVSTRLASSARGCSLMIWDLCAGVCVFKLFNIMIKGLAVVPDGAGAGRGDGVNRVPHLLANVQVRGVNTMLMI